MNTNVSIDRSNNHSMEDYAAYNDVLIAREGRRRSVSESEVWNREVEVRDSLERSVPQRKDDFGTSWIRTAVVDSSFGPQNAAVRELFAERLQAMGYGDKRTFKDVYTFISSLPRLVDSKDIDFVLDETTWNFLMAAWVRDSHGDQGANFDFGLASYFKEKIITRRAGLLAANVRERHLTSYGRELMFVSNP